MTKVFYSLSEIKKVIRTGSRVFLVTSKSLSKKLDWAIRKLKVPKPSIIAIPDGEKAKTWDSLYELLREFSRRHVDRSSVVLALGGGSVGDLVGFASSVYLRGVPYIQVPTSLLSQVDSAHGGKTGINFLGLKNQIGSFYAPKAVVVDTRFLKNIPEELVVDGLGEIIKAGFIKDASILKLLEKETVSTLIQSKNLEKIIRKTIAVKNYYTERDLRDIKLRQILNVGHTVGHALELKYKINHGRAVIVGMMQEFVYTEKRAWTKALLAENLASLLRSLGIKIDSCMRADFSAISHDKKISGSRIVLPVVEKIGKTTLKLVEVDELKNLDQL